MKNMKKEYDFSKAEKGKFYRPIEDIELPIYLDKKLKNYYLKIASSKKIPLEKVINIILKKEMELQKQILNPK
jgi:hypothetical protein